MRSLSGASLAIAAVLALGSAGCSKVGELQAMKSFKAANQAYSQQDYKKAAELYEQAIQAAPDTQAGHQSYFFLGNSYDNLYKPSKKGDAANDALLTKAVDNYTKAAETLSTSNDPIDKTLGQAVAGIPGQHLRRREAERSGQGGAGAAEDDPAGSGRPGQLLPAREAVRGRRRLRSRRTDVHQR